MNLRAVRPNDQAYIASTWTRSVCSTHRVPGASGKGHVYQRHIGSQMWDAVSKQVDAVMDRSDSRGIVAHRDADLDAILGWAVYCLAGTVPVVHFCYVRREARGNGIARAMLAHIGVTHDKAVVCTSLGPSSAWLRSAYPASGHLPLSEFLAKERR